MTPKEERAEYLRKKREAILVSREKPPKSSLGICIRCMKTDGEDAIPGECKGPLWKRVYKRHAYAF